MEESIVLDREKDTGPVTLRYQSPSIFDVTEKRLFEILDLNLNDM